MATDIEYAALAAYVYNESRGGGDTLINHLALPPGWEEAELLGFSAGATVNFNPVSATAVALVNTSTGEIVISYKGTDFLSGTGLKTVWDTAADLLADLGLATSLRAFGTWQQIVAATYYLAVKDWAVSNGYDPSKISFTGHSLGGGLAANMAVWFDHPAVTFAEAPFEASTRDPVAIAAAKVALVAQAGVMMSQAVLEDIDKLSTVNESFAEREAGVTNYFIRGEALDYLRAILLDVAGSERPIDMGPQPLDRAMALHSINLHLALQADPRLVDACILIPELLPALLDESLYFADPNYARPDFVTRLVADQMHGALDRQDGLLGKFTSDVLKLRSGSGTAAQRPVRAALIAAAMEYYIQHGSADASQIFTVSGGGVHYKYSDIGALSYKSLSRLQAAVVAGLQTSEQAFASKLRLQNAWHVQSGDQALSWSAGPGPAESDAAIGGVGNDAMDGGTGSDILVGSAGSDSLTGGTGNDTLLGGTGSDMYVFNTGDGNDTIVDADLTGTIKVDGVVLGGGVETSPGSGSWSSTGKTVLYSLHANSDGSQTLDISYGLGANHIYVRNFTSVRMGIWLQDGQATPFAADLTLIGDTSSTGQPMPGQLDSLAGDDGNDLIQALGGRDMAWGGGGRDVVEGGAEIDILDSGAGDDRVYAVAEVDLEQAISAGATDIGTGLPGDWLYAGDGTDMAVGSVNDDALFGGRGSDTVIGGAGDDFLSGDSTRVVNDGYSTYNPNFFNWQITWDDAPNVGDEFTPIFSGMFRFEFTQQDEAAGGAADILHGGSGDDYLEGMYGDDVLYGDSGDDRLVGGEGSDMLFGGDGDDRIAGEAGAWAIPGGGDDYIDGGAGNDWMTGEAGNDSLIGGAGNDTLYGDRYYEIGDEPEHGDDYLDGGDGDDSLTGQGGNDLLFGGAGNDTLIGDNSTVLPEYMGDDYLDGGDGNDSLSGWGGSDELFGGAGDDSLFGGDGADYLDGEDGVDSLSGNAGDDELYGGAGNDTLSGGDGHDFLSGEGEDDKVYGNAGDDILFAGDGADEADGGDGSDQVYGEAGDDQLWGGTGRDLLSGGDGNDQLAGGGDDDTLEGGNGDDTLFGEAGNDILRGGDGVNVLQGDAGNDILVGGANDDSLFGGDGDDTLDGGAGVDYLDGGAGTNTYILHDEGPWEASLARTTIANAGGTTTLVFTADVSASSVSWVPTTGDSDMALRYGSGDLVYVVNGIKSEVISQVRFADGTVWSRADLMALAPALTVIGGAANDSIQGGSQADSLSGAAGDDVISAGKGDDSLSGGAGSDTYVFNAGDGADLVDNYAADNGSDTVMFGTGVAPEDVAVYRIGNNLVLKAGAVGADSITISGYYAGADRKVANVMFADGTAWDQAALEARAIWAIASATEGNNNISGLPGDDEIHGLGGDDMLQGLDGDDRLFGDAGADTLTGGAGDDYLDGGGAPYSLKDNLAGGTGSDTYVFHGGDGNLLVNETGTGAGEIDTLVLGFTRDEADLRRGGTNSSHPDLIIVREGTNDVVTVWGFFAQETTRRIERIQFSDGTQLTGDDVFAMLARQPTTGNDTVEGYNWADSIDGLAGSDILRGFGGDDVLAGGAGADFIYGHDGNDVLDGGAGTDYMEGGAGADTYVFGWGSGRDQIVESGESTSTNDTIRLAAGITAADLTLFEYEDSLVLSLDGSNDELWILDHYLASGDKQVETIAFADGSSMQVSAMAVVHEAPAHAWVGTAADDTFVIGNPNDTISEGADQGDDTVESRYGWDLRSSPNVENLTLTGPLGVNGSGNELDNILQGSSGNDYLSGWGGQDNLAGGGGDDGLDGDAGDDLLLGDAGDDTLDGGDGADTLLGGEGDDALDGGSGADSLYGDAGNDTLRGSVGDTLFGGTGDDTYGGMLYASDPQVVEYEGEGIDTIVCDWGMRGSWEDLADQVENLTINPDRGTRQTIEYLNGNALDNRITGGDYGDIIDGRAGADTMIGGRGSDTFYVDNAGDVVIDAGGIDKVVSSVSIALSTGIESVELSLDAGPIDASGNAGNNTITGNYGDNVLDGGAGNDTLIGNYGDDTLIGGSGNDTYVISTDMGGNQVVVDNAASDNATTVDVIVLSNLAANYTFDQSGDDLVITDVTSSATVLVRGDHAITQDNAIDTIQFADTTWERRMFGGVRLSGGGALAGSVHNDTLTATAGGTTLNGLDGDDSLTTIGDGAVFGHTYVGGRGGDNITGSYAGDTYRFARGDGHDVIDDDVRSLGSQGVADFFAANPWTTSYQDLLEFTDIASTQVSARRESGTADLVLEVAASGDEVRIRDWFDGTMFAKIESLRFADGVTWLASDVDTMLGESSVGLSQSGGGTLQGSQYDDSLTATSGGINLLGGAGRDHLAAAQDGGVFGLAFEGGAGDDVLSGSYAGDTYRFSRGDGQDLIQDDVRSLGMQGVTDFFAANPWTESYQDVLEFADFTSGQVTARREQVDLVLTVGTGGDEVRIQNWFDGTMFAKIESIRFADGVSWLASDIDAMLGESSPGLNLSGGGTLQGSQYDDLATATAGSATLLGGAGRDQLAAAADGGVFGLTFEGGKGNDVLTGSYAGDTYRFSRGDGHDLIEDDVRSLGSQGVTDFFAANPETQSYQDAMQFSDIASTEVIASRDQSDLVLAIAGTNDEVRIRNWYDGTMYARIESFQFADGVTWMASEVDAMLHEPSPGVTRSGGGTISGSQYQDDLTATAYGTSLQGQGGNDVLRATVDNGVFAVEMTGGRGNDTLYGSYAGDTYVFNPGDGDDLVIDDVRSLGSQGVNDYFQAHPEDTAYHDHLLFGAGIDPQDVSYARWGNDMLFTVAGGGSVTVQNWFDGTPFSRIEKIDFASGAPSWNGSQLTAA